MAIKHKRMTDKQKKLLEDLYYAGVPLRVIAREVGVWILTVQNYITRYCNYVPVYKRDDTPEAEDLRYRFHHWNIDPVQVNNLLHKDVSYTDIAKRCDVSVRTVYRFAQAMGYHRHGRTRRVKVSDTILETVLSLHKQGVSMKAISRKFNIPYPTVRRYCQSSYQRAKARRKRRPQDVKHI